MEHFRWRACGVGTVLCNLKQLWCWPSPPTSLDDNHPAFPVTIGGRARLRWEYLAVQRSVIKLLQHAS